MQINYKKCCICALPVLLTKNKIIGWIMLGIGTVILFTIFMILHKKRHIVTQKELSSLKKMNIDTMPVEDKMES